uniref:LSM14 domain-containing protein n=1 Tax=Steinernema glaseri TaxID=37863 RepID=A0A1I8AI58_9BILA
MGEPSTSSGIIEEVLGVYNGFVFKDDSLGPVFCKPKLIPLKSVTLEKLQDMQQMAVDVRKTPSPEPESDQPSTSKAPTETNIWAADE